MCTAHQQTFIRKCFMFLSLNRWQRSLLCHESAQLTSKQLGWIYTVTTDCFGGTCRTNKTGHNRSFVKLSQTCEVMQLLRWTHCGFSGSCLEEVNIMQKLLCCYFPAFWWAVFGFCPTITKSWPSSCKKKNDYLAGVPWTIIESINT